MATVRMPSSLAVRKTRMAISLRLATSSLRIGTSAIDGPSGMAAGPLGKANGNAGQHYPRGSGPRLPLHPNHGRGKSGREEREGWVEGRANRPLGDGLSLLQLPGNGCKLFQGGLEV